MTVSAMPPAVVAEAAVAARAWLRVPDGQGADGQDDASIAALAASALALAEAFCGVVLVARAATDTLAGRGAAAGGWQPLGHAPVTAVTAVAAGTPPVALAADAYAIDIDPAGNGWVRFAVPVEMMPVTIGYSAGAAADWAALPAPIAQGVAMLVAHLNDTRDGDQAPPAAVAALWRPWRRLALAPERRR